MKISIYTIECKQMRADIALILTHIAGRYWIRCSRTFMYEYAPKERSSEPQRVTRTSEGAGTSPNISPSASVYVMNLCMHAFVDLLCMHAFVYLLCMHAFVDLLCMHAFINLSCLDVLVVKKWTWVAVYLTMASIRIVSHAYIHAYICICVLFIHARVFMDVLCVCMSHQRFELMHLSVLCICASCEYASVNTHVYTSCMYVVGRVYVYTMHAHLCWCECTREYIIYMLYGVCMYIHSTPLFDLWDRIHMCMPASTTIITKNQGEQRLRYIYIYIYICICIYIHTNTRACMYVAIVQWYDTGLYIHTCTCVCMYVYTYTYTYTYIHTYIHTYIYMNVLHTHKIT